MEKSPLAMACAALSFVEQSSLESRARRGGQQKKERAMADTMGFDQPTNGSGNGSGLHFAGYTGRYIVSFDPSAADDAANVLRDKAGLHTDSARALGDEPPGERNVVLEEIATAIVDAPPDQHSALEAAVADSNVPILRVEPERINWALAMQPPAALRAGALVRQNSRARRGEGPVPAPPDDAPVRTPSARVENALGAEFLRGYAAAVNGLVAALERADALDERTQDFAVAALGATWGLGATHVVESAFSGRGIRVAVLDTGFDLHHPDFSGRTVVSRSFISGEAVQDGHGHGTHCIGTSCGPRNPATGPRYGVAYGAEIYAGKVLSNAGSGGDGGILAGINWAVANRCAIVSMSLGSMVEAGERYSEVYQNAAQIAAQKGTLIIAAAGNDSERPGFIAPVGRPANCPSIIAVAALDSTLRVAPFSCGGINPGGGEVNVTGPGVGVTSSWPMPIRYRTISGTSMATPHVAGIAALYAEATGLRGMALANHLLNRSRRMFPIRDFGWGLVQAT
jgi:subtilisin family serine protease